MMNLKNIKPSPELVKIIEEGHVIDRLVGCNNNVLADY